METFLIIAVIVLLLAVIAMANKKKPTFGKRQFIGLADATARDFSNVDDRKKVVKYVKMTTEICGVQFTALQEIKEEMTANAAVVTKNNATIGELESQISGLKSEIEAKNRQNNTLAVYQNLL